MSFIIVWDDQQGVCFPMGWDEDCDGALCGFSKTVAVFADRKEAKAAINVSTKFALLQKAMGRPVNEDVLGECKKNLKIVPLAPKAP